MPYAWKGICYGDTAGALSAFVKSIPDADAAGINSFTAAPTVNVSGLITWSISNRPLTGTTATIRSGTTQLPLCSNPSMDQWSVQSMNLYAVLFFACFLGFRSGFRP